MARPRSQEKQLAILQATRDLIAQHGLNGASTALIAKKAGVAEGTIFHYFTNKDRLLNQVYVFLKEEVSQALAAIEASQDFSSHLRQVWEAYIDWGCSHPEASRAISQIFSSGLLTSESLDASQKLLPNIDIGLSTSEQPLFGPDNDFIESLFLAIADTTIDFALKQPGRQDHYTEIGLTMLQATYQAGPSKAP